MVVTTEGNITSNASQPLRSGPAPPLAGPDVNASAANHTSVLLMWSPPHVKLLRGAAQSYRVDVQEASPGKPVSIYAVVPGNQTHIVVTRLKPSTDYNFEVNDEMLGFQESTVTSPNLRIPRTYCYLTPS